jgi:hypothetical protein
LPVKPMVTENNIKVLKELMTGKYLRYSMSGPERSAFKDKTGISSVDLSVRKLESMGVIIGYAPVLSEDGVRLIRALEVVYDLSKDGKMDPRDPLDVLMEDDG